jgi:hypothetical protein
MRILIYLAVLLALLSLGSLWAFAAPVEKVDMTPEQLQKTATHVVVGEVKQIWTREESDSNWKTTHYCAELAVSAVEKGEGIEPRGVVYLRYWRRQWVGSGPIPPSTNGHRGLPEAGSDVRVYLARNSYDGFGSTKDGGFNVIGANGFAAAASSESNKSPGVPSGR